MLGMNTLFMKYLHLFLFILIFSSASLAQTSPFDIQLETRAGMTSNDAVPFWMRSNQYGSMPIEGASGSFIGSIYKHYDTKKGLVKWGMGLQGRANVGKSSNFTLIEGYGKVKVGIFELKAGRSKEVFGLADTLLSSGNFAISGNAPGIPKIQLSIPDFYSIPVWGGFFAVKGNFAHGWMGFEDIQYKRIDKAVTYFHQKSFWLRMGKPTAKYKIYGGFTDNAMWGNEEKIFESYPFSNWKSFQSVLYGKSWAFSKVGNHLGSLDLRFEYDLESYQLAAYRQSFYEVGGLYHLANVADGLNGISIVNKYPAERRFKWNKFLFEMLYTKNQAGEAWSKPTPSGDEDYYNHYMYSKGWSYQNLGLGTPFITPNHLAKKEIQNTNAGYFLNNRVIAFHAGLTGSFDAWQYTSKFSYSRNFGTHSTKNTFTPVGQFSGYLEAKRQLPSGFAIGGALAVDAGNLLPGSVGVYVSAAKKF